MVPPYSNGRPNIHTSITEVEHAIDRSISENVFPVAQTSEEASFFHNNPRPAYMDELIQDTPRARPRQDSVSDFWWYTVPLENNTVRFIDNFSAGTRGAASAEQFLKNGYSVIFLHREFSLTPYNRKFTHNLKNSFLDFIDKDGVVKPEFKEQVLENKRLYDLYVSEEKKLLLLPFTTVNQYLWSLKSVAKLLDSRGSLFYLAAAVSDFFVPHSRMPQHKIQSRDYKLDGDNSSDDTTTTTADGKLITRNKEVVFVSSTNRDGDWIRLDNSVKTIEELIVPEVIKRHDAWVAKNT
ncbi:related to Phosphopantothenate--cysteine ligase CAB2 [Nakaseomyces glabratus]|nr:related to Phosphopantothenate--cysteine ligase CAB2 [Nakaseomyces glabratus]